MNSSWIAYTKETTESQRKILMFPHSGAGASVFAPWGKLFQREGFSYYPIQYPMRETRKQESMPRDLVSLAQDIVEALPEIFQKDSYLLYGRCMGSLVAYEVARYAWEKYQTTPGLFIAVSAYAPCDAMLPVFPQEASQEELAKCFAEKHFITEENLKDQMFLNFYLPVLKADYIMQANYKPKNSFKLSCPIICLYGKQDEFIEWKHLKNWQQYSSQKVTCVGFEGKHFFENKKVMEEICRKIKNLC